MRAFRALVALAGAGLAVVAAAPGARAEDPADPWEAWNRPVFAFNDFLSRHALEPLGRGWRWLVPEPGRRGLQNLFENLATPLVFVNDVLQGKPRAAGHDLARLLLNLSVGPAGLFLDPAQVAVGLDPNDEDFGQTLGVWGVPPGPYLMLPLLGPSSPRDAAGTAVDAAAYYPLGLVAPFYATASARAVDLANDYSFSVDDLAEERAEAFDWYVAVRNAHVSRRQNQVLDRAEPEDDEGGGEDELYFPEEALEEP